MKRKKKRKTRQILIWSISAGVVGVVFLSCACGVGLWWRAPWAGAPLVNANLLGPATPNTLFEKTVTLKPGAVDRYDFPAKPWHQWVSVHVDSPEPLHVHLTAGVAADEVRNALERNQIPMGASGKRNVKQDWFATGVPVNMTPVVFLTGAQKQTEVKLKVTTKPQTADDK
jgi:hypothetical protein